MKKKAVVVLLLTLFLTFNLLVSPSAKMSVVAAPNKILGKSFDSLKTKTKIQKDQDNKVTTEEFVMPASIVTGLNLSISKTDLRLNESATIQLTLDNNDGEYDTVYVNMVVFYEGQPFTTYVTMDRISEKIFEGEITIFNGTVSGSYDVFSVELLSASAGTYQEVLSDAYFGPDEGELMDLPENFMVVSGTIGGYQPASSLTFELDDYVEGDLIKVKLEVDEAKVDFYDAVVWFGQYANDFEKAEYIYLEETQPGIFEGTIEVSMYFAPGKYNVLSVFLNSLDYSIDIYAQEYNEYYQFNSDYVESYDDFFTIHGTIVDNNGPVLQSLTTSKTFIEKTETSRVTITATDDISGLEGGSIQITGSNGDIVYGDLIKIDDHTLIYDFKLSPFERTSPKYSIDYISLYDHSKNNTHLYGEQDFGITTIVVAGYSNVGEISGSNRYNTAIEISKHFSYVDTVIIALGNDFPDALSAGPLSYSLNAPILLAQTNRVSQSTLDEISRLGATNAIILGGPAAITEDVVNQIKGAGITNIKRIYGTNRYWTAVAVGEYLYEQQLGSTGSKREYAILASGTSFPDALAAASLASIDGRPILLTSATKLHPETKRFLQEEGVKYVSVIGGPSVISDEIIAEIEGMGILVNRHGGTNRYNTSVIIATRFFPESRIAFVANGLNFADALAAAPLAAMNDAPILLVRDSVLPSGVADYLSDSFLNKLEHVTVVGGDAAVNDSVKSSMSNALDLRE